jgi:type I restriction enzyme, S subunit
MWHSGRAGLYENQSTGIANFQFEHFLDRERVWLPELDEQDRIASVLGVLDDKIDSNRRLANRLEGAAHHEFRRRFGGRVEGPDRLGDHVIVIRGRSYKSSELAASERALVTLKSVRPGGGYQPAGLKPYIGDYKSEQVVHPGEIVVAHTDLTQNAAVVGKPALVPDSGPYTELIASLDLAIVRPSTNVLSVSYLYYLLMEPAFQQHAYGHANGSTVLHMSKDAIPSFSITLPRGDDLAAFDRVARPVVNAANRLLREVMTLAAIRDLLLPKLISGEIRVSDTADPEEVIGPVTEQLVGAGT